MKQVKMECLFEVREEAELCSEDKLLVEAAREATHTSYSPYSHFSVGAAVRLASGRIVTGSNQENAAYGMCQCAERNALFAAACKYPDEAPVAIAVAAQSFVSRPQHEVEDVFLSQPIPPCGACRQVMLETEERYGQQLHILLFGTEGTWVCEGIKNLLPLKFVGETMANQ